MKESRVWRAHVGLIAWSTIALSVMVVGGHALSTWAAWVGRIPLWEATVVNTVLAYVAFTPVHEAAHGNIFGGRKRYDRLETFIGWVSALLLLKPYALFRRMHLQHHGRTNDPDKDPDHWVAASNPLSITLRCLTIYPWYHWVAFKSGVLFGRAGRSSVVFTSTLVVALLTVAWMGYGLEVLATFVVPAWLAMAGLALSLDWAPHHPHDGRGRYKDTRVLLGPGLELVMMAHNLHLIHHLWPRVPWYRYRAVFDEIRPELEQRGVVIVELGRKRAVCEPAEA